jgi:hypothetical protein
VPGDLLDPWYIERGNCIEAFGQIWWYDKWNGANGFVSKEFIWFNGKDAPVIHEFDAQHDIEPLYGAQGPNHWSDRGGNFLVREDNGDGTSTVWQLGKTKLKVADVSVDLDGLINTVMVSMSSNVSAVILQNSQFDNSIRKIVFLSSDQEIIATKEYSGSNYRLWDTYHFGSIGRLAVEIRDENQFIQNLIVCDYKTKSLIEESWDYQISYYVNYLHQPFTTKTRRFRRDMIVVYLFNGPGYGFKVIYLGASDSQFYSKEWATQPNIYEQVNNSDSVYVLTDEGTGTTWYSNCLTGGNDYLHELGSSYGSPGGHEAFGKNLVALFSENNKIEVFRDGVLLDTHEEGNQGVQFYFGVMFIRTATDELKYFAEDVGKFTVIPNETGDSWDWSWIFDLTNSYYYQRIVNIQNPGCHHDHFIVHTGPVGEPSSLYLITSKGHTKIDLASLQEEDSNFYAFQRYMTDGAALVFSENDGNSNYDEMEAAYDINGFIGRDSVPLPFQRFDQIGEAGRALQSQWDNQNPTYPFKVTMLGKKGNQVIEFNGGVWSIGTNVYRP